MECAALDQFFIQSDTKAHVLESFEKGFASTFEYKPPAPWGYVNNYPPLLTAEGRKRFRDAMQVQVRTGKMIGGPGWSATCVRSFFGGRQFYGIPSGAVSKGSDPYGRIVHDYGYYRIGSYSVNAAHANTSVVYMKTKERIRILEHVNWYVKADLSSGFRQFGTHPKDWIYQVYCNGPREHYIDLACPFGKTNSPMEFCPPVALFAKSAAVRYAERFGGSPPNIGSYVDDIIGGFPHCPSYRKACHFRV